MNPVRVTIEQYWMPDRRDLAFPAECTAEVRANALELLQRVNVLLEMAALDDVYTGVDEVTRGPVASGWRPPAVNDRTANSAKGTSSHMTGEGIDLEDHPETRALAVWCCKNRDVLERLGLWMEDPRWTGGRPRGPGEGERDPWVHLQIRAASRLIYIPYRDLVKNPANDPDFYTRNNLKVA